MSIIVAETKESAELLDVLGFGHVENGLDLLLPRFYSGWSKIVAEEVCFLDSPLAFLWIDGVSMLIQGVENFVKHVDVLGPSVAEASDVINVGFDAFKILKCLFDEFLSNVR